jgi:predicted phosphodiesterase
MQKTVLIPVLLFLINLTCQAQTLRRTEILGRPTDNSITLQLIFSDSAEVRVSYGTTPGTYTSQTAWLSFAGEEPAEIVLTGLQPDTRYYYRVRHRIPGDTIATSRPEYTFHTQRPAATPFTFVVQADPHLDSQSDTALYRLCLQNQLDDAPDFMVDLGDFLMSEKMRDATNQIPFDTVAYRCELLRDYYEKTCHSVPLYNVIGNHEGENGWYKNGTASNIAIWNNLARKKYFLNPFPDAFYSGDTMNHPFVGIRESYYAWHWGDALFIVLDPYWNTAPKPDSLTGWRWTLGQAQYEWLKNTLDNSTARFKFVFCHQLVGGDPDGRGGIEYADRYEWGGNNLDGTPGFATNRPGWYKPIKDLLTENRVNIFFHGHDHFFAKQEKECMIYQETPQPSHPNFMNANQAAVYGYVQGQILPNAGHLRVTVDSSGVQVEYVRAYLPVNETPTRHNKDVSATYFIGSVNCYDSLTTGVPVLWNSDYMDELVYPNPFSSETRIEFSVAEQEKLDISIYSEGGVLVKKLIAGSEVPQGRYQVIWDGKSYSGTGQPQGFYFYTITGSKGLRKTGKIILQR